MLRYLSPRTVAMALMAAMMLMLFSIQIASADDGKAALSMAPADSMMVLAINVDSLKSSPLYKEALKMALSDGDVKKAFSEMKTKIGFDVEKDISSVVIVLPPDVDKSEDFLMIAKGNFNEEAIVKFMTSEKVPFAIENYAGKKFYSFKDGGKVVAGLSFSGSHAIVGTLPMLKKALDAAGGKNLAKDAGMATLLSTVDTTKDIWTTIDLPESLKKEMGHPMAMSLKTVTSSISVKDGLGLKVNIGTTDSKTAESLTGIINDGVKQAGADPTVSAMGFGGMITKLTAAQAGTTINISLNLTASELQKIQTTLAGFIR